MSSSFLSDGESIPYHTYTYQLDNFTVTYYFPFALLVNINGVNQFYTVDRIKSIWLKLEPSDTKERAVLIVQLISSSQLRYATVNTSENRALLRQLIRDVKEVLDGMNASVNKKLRK